MPGSGNVFKYSTSDEMNRSIRKGNTLVGTSNSIEYGPTKTGYINPAINVDSTARYWWNGTVPATGGYFIWRANQSTPTTGEPAIATLANDAALISWVNSTYSQSTTTAAAALSYLAANQTDIICTDRIYPDIVTNGLVQLFDPGYSPSMPRTGTTMYSMGGSTGATLSSLVNGAVWGSTGGGAISLDGTNDFISFTGTNAFYGASGDFTWQIMTNYRGGTTTTIQGLLWSEVSGGSKNFLLAYANTNTANTYIRFDTASGVFPSVTTGTQSNGFGNTAGPIIGGWKFATFVKTGTNFLFYWNDAVQMWSLNTSTFSVGNTAQNVVVGNRNDAAYPSDMEVGLVYAYNRALNTTEISQNFNAIKDRYGITGAPPPPSTNAGFGISSNSDSGVTITAVSVNGVGVTRTRGGVLPIGPGGGGLYSSGQTGTQTITVDYSNTLSNQTITITDSTGAEYCQSPLNIGSGTVTFTNANVTNANACFVNAKNGGCQ